MKKIAFPLLAGLVLVVVLAVLHMSGALYSKNAVRAQVDSHIGMVESAFNTIDLQQAATGGGFEPPRMLNPPDVIPALLRYPPSAEDLAKLSG
jgi:hypothetical protein